MPPLKKKPLEKHYRIGQVAEALGMTVTNVRTYLRKGTIRGVRTPGGHWRIPESEVKRILEPTGQAITAPSVPTCIIYARVSSQKQKNAGNLTRQIERLHEYARQQQFQVLKIITDVGSGLNEKRKGLAQLLRLVETQPVDYVLVEFQDRLTRFGFRYLSAVLAAYGIEVHVKEQTMKNHEKEGDLNKELVEDLLAIIYSFSGKLYGRRSAKFRQLKRCVAHVTQTEEET